MRCWRLLKPAYFPSQILAWICFYRISCLSELHLGIVFSLLPSLPLLFPPCSYICFHFSACVTNSKEIPNCGRPKPAAPPPAFSWQKTLCLAFNGECFARLLGLGEIQWGNSGNLIGWAVPRTVKPLYKEGARTALELLQKHNRVLLFFSDIPRGECGTNVSSRKHEEHLSWQIWLNRWKHQMSETLYDAPLFGFSPDSKKNNANIAKTCGIY